MPAFPIADWFHRGFGRRRIIGALAFGCLLTLTPAQAQFGQLFPGLNFEPAPQPRQSRAEAREPLMTLDARIAMQEALQARGLYNGPLDGALGGGTRRAIAAYQRTVRESATGYLTAGQLKRLLQARPEDAVVGTPPPETIETDSPAMPPGTTAGAGAQAQPATPRAGTSPTTAVAPTPTRSGPSAIARPFEVRSHIYAGTWNMSSVQGLPETNQTQYAKLARWLELYSLSKIRAEHPDAVPSGAMLSRMMSDYLTSREIADVLRDVNTFENFAKKDVMSQIVPGAGSAIALYVAKVNPLELLDMQKRFARDYLPRIVPGEVTPPKKLVFVTGVQLKDYDDGIGGFRFHPPQSPLSPPYEMALALKLKVTGLQDWFAIPRDKAKSLVSKQTTMYLAFFCDINEPAVEANLSADRGNLNSFSVFHPENSMFSNFRSMSQYSGDNTAYKPQKQGDTQLVLTGIGVFADPQLKDLIATLPVSAEDPGVIPGLGGQGSPRAPVPVAVGPAAGNPGGVQAPETANPPGRPQQPEGGQALQKPQGGETATRSAVAAPVIAGLDMIDGAVTIGGDALWFHRMRALSWKAGKRTYGEIESDARLRGDAHAGALLRYLTAIGYVKWHAEAPAASTPASLAAPLIALWLDDAQIRALFDDLTDKQLKPMKPYLPQSENRSSRAYGVWSSVERLDEQSRQEILNRFDTRHRPRIVQVGAKAPRAMVNLTKFPLNNYDFAAQGFPLYSGNNRPSPDTRQQTLQDIAGSAERMTVGTTLTYVGAPWPAVMPMGENDARKLLAEATKAGNAAQFINATFLTVDDVTLTSSDRGLKINIDATLVKRGTYADVALSRLIWQPDEPADPEQPTTSPDPAPLAAAPATPIMSAASSPPPLTSPAPAPRPTTPAAPAPASPPAAPQIAAIPPAPAPVPTPAPPIASRPVFDVVGIRLGMDLAEAEPLVRQHMPESRVVEMGPADPRQLVTFGNARVYVSQDNTEYLALVTQPERSGGRIVAVGRYVFGGLGAFDREELINDLSAKYGGKPLRGSQLLHWGGEANPPRNETACHLMLGTVMNAKWTDPQGRTPNWSEYVPAAGVGTTWRGPASMNWLGLRVNDLQRLGVYAGCQPTVAVWAPEINGRSGEFSLWLSDTKAYVDILTRPPLAGGGAGAPGGKVKL